MKYLLTLDVGTTAVKAALFSEALQPVAFAIREYTLLTPKASFIELDPESYWEKTRQAIEEVMAVSGLDNSAIGSITCATQGETLIPISENGDHLSNAIVWLDSRGQAEADLINEHFDKELIYSTTGLPQIDGYCPVAKVLWLKTHIPDLYKATYKILLLEDYIVFRLSGKLVTNPSVMSSTGYFDIHTDRLWREMLEFCGLSDRLFPEIIKSGRVVGGILPSVAEELHLSKNVQITTGAMDQVASAIGSGNIRAGVITETTGTAQVVAATCEKETTAEWSPVMVYRHAIEDKFLKIIINQTAGMAYKWFRNEFCMDLVKSGDGFDQMNALAAQEPPLSRGLTFFPHLTGMQFPQADESMRGVFFGIGLDSNRGCFIRAIQEGVGYMLRESIEEMGLRTDRIISLGGGAKSELWCQIKADICGAKIAVLENDESTSVGAAILGSVATGLLGNIEKATHFIAQKREYVPISANAQLYAKGYLEFKSMYNAFSPIFKKR